MLSPKSLRLPGEEAPGVTAFGSITVEASLALTVFLTFIMALLSLFPILQTELETGYQLTELCRAAAEASALLSPEDASYDGDIYLRKDYSEKAETLFGNVFRVPITVKACIRAWTGRTLWKEEEQEAGEDTAYVYVCEDGRVYHLTDECTHIFLSVKTTDLSAVGGLRNDYGGKYYPCERCGSVCREGDVIYIAVKGDRYHSDRKCGGLKRTYRRIPLSETSFPACSRCGGG